LILFDLKYNKALEMELKRTDLDEKSLQGRNKKEVLQHSQLILLN